MFNRDYGVGALLWFIFLPILLPLSIFFGNVILFDSLLVSVASGLLANKAFSIHPAISLVIGIIVLVSVYKLYHTDIGFWVFGILFTIAVSAITSALVRRLTNGDLIWGWITFGLSVGFVGWLHYANRDRSAFDFINVLFLD